MKRTPIDSHVPASLVSDLQTAITAARRPGVAVRLIRLAPDVLGRALDAVAQRNPFMPFSPTLCGIPCDFAQDGITTLCTVTDTADQTDAVRILDHTGKPCAA